MYGTNSNELRALDARSGRLIWQYRDGRAKKEAVNRGAAILGERVFFMTTDCHLVALDRRTGAVLWQKKYASVDDGLNSPGMPLALKDKVLVGVGGGDTGMRGFIAALSASTGEELWRTYTIPAKGEPGSETWGNYVEYGGGATWLSGTYDPQLNLLYWATGNAWPGFYGGHPPGGNLFSFSLLPRGAGTRHVKWDFPFPPPAPPPWLPPPPP